MFRCRYSAPLVGLLVLLLLLTGCGGGGDQTTEATATTPMLAAEPGEATEAPAMAEDEPDEAAQTDEEELLRLATTTSTADSGLLDAILPDFEQEYNAQVDVIAVGTGQALELGENCDADVVLVHARSREDEFVENGFGVNRRDVMYNDFVVVGPVDDPAGIEGMTTAAEAFSAIADNEATFASRGDDSGTHTKEQAIWGNTDVDPTADMEWYNSLGQGMGATLIAANEQLAYTMADRGTFLSMGDSLPDLTILVGGQSIEANEDPILLNPYGVIPVSPDNCPTANSALSEQFADWLIAEETQAQIGEFGTDTYDQPLFFPGAAPES